MLNNPEAGERATKQQKPSLPVKGAAKPASLFSEGAGPVHEVGNRQARYEGLPCGGGSIYRVT